jgi:hypothetical protein
MFKKRNVVVNHCWNPGEFLVNLVILVVYRWCREYNSNNLVSILERMSAAKRNPFDIIPIR